MNKKDLTEADIRTKYITPAVLGQDGSKWDSMTQVREEFYFTKGRVIVRGKSVKRGEAKKSIICSTTSPIFPLWRGTNSHLGNVRRGDFLRMSPFGTMP